MKSKVSKYQNFVTRNERVKSTILRSRVFPFFAFHQLSPSQWDLVPFCPILKINNATRLLKLFLFLSPFTCWKKRNDQSDGPFSSANQGPDNSTPIKTSDTRFERARAFITAYVIKSPGGAAGRFAVSLVPCDHDRAAMLDRHTIDDRAPSIQGGWSSLSSQCGYAMTRMSHWKVVAGWSLWQKPGDHSWQRRAALAWLHASLSQTSQLVARSTSVLPGHPPCNLHLVLWFYLLSLCVVIPIIHFPPPPLRPR